MLLLLSLSLMVLLVCATATSSASKPNIIFVVADDLGWNDVGWHNPDMITPNLNHFAHEGVILNSSYVQYFCSPSRNAFMTGYFPYHTGLQHQVIFAGQPRYVPLNFTMLPQLLKQAGYDTHIIGKWHLGMCNWNYTPTYRGFDSFFGYYNGAEDYYNHTVKGGYDLRNNKEVLRDPTDTHFTYMLTERAVELIQQQETSDSPLFLYLPFHLVHNPLQVPMSYQDLYKNIQHEDRRIYSGMVSMMDEAFGNITRALDTSGLLNNSLLIFTTDNGGMVTFGANNWPLRGAKTTFWEGGTRGPAFVWSRDLLNKTAYVHDGLFHAVDWFPTILHVAGVQPESGIDGVNQWNMLSTGAPSNRNEFVYNIDTIMNSTAIRYGDYKLMTGSPGRFNDWYPTPSSLQDPTTTPQDHPSTSQHSSTTPQHFTTTSQHSTTACQHVTVNTQHSTTQRPSTTMQHSTTASQHVTVTTPQHSTTQRPSTTMQHTTLPQHPTAAHQPSTSQHSAASQYSTTLQHHTTPQHHSTQQHSTTSQDQLHPAAPQNAMASSASRSQSSPVWKPQLYNIKDDPEERHDLADSEPEMLSRMLERLEHWMASGVPPQNSDIDPKGSPDNWGGVWTPGWC